MIVKAGADKNEGEKEQCGVLHDISAHGQSECVLLLQLVSHDFSWLERMANILLSGHHLTDMFFGFEPDVHSTQTCPFHSLTHS